MLVLGPEIRTKEERKINSDLHDGSDEDDELRNGTRRVGEGTQDEDEDENQGAKRMRMRQPLRRRLRRRRLAVGSFGKM